MKYDQSIRELNPERSEDRLKLIARGITPRLVEQLYEEHRARDFSVETGVRKGQLTRLARAWGINTDWYRRDKHLTNGPGSRGRAA